MIWLDPILRPLARLAVRKGWLFPIVEHRLRHAYIEAADTLGEDPSTDSKVSILTGLQRRDIARLRREVIPPQNQRQPLAEIIALWWDNPAYDPKGIFVQGDGPSFTDLARCIRKDVHPRTFLDVLIENGAVKEIGDKVILNTRSYQPLSGSDDQLAYLADNVGDHLATAVSNVVGEAGNYDMSVHYKGLSASAIEQLDKHFRARMKQTLQELDTMARTLPATEDGPHRFRAGGYFSDDLNCKAK
ncbi:hypothetical protein C1J03_08110 [Sulfitobacter sp. SK012]|uniref:DUF6502 family protein n=1 Tax=Sulfitobacter sp. SK012 TaxID=1389005 RepID=UPI000E0C8ED6|nr:DUF6502 family protein [Sulfitobacter sp. SK012]AXI45986.1 hypothetical protein C1J03_08110 [Sulfitobacter sp. SK012]